MYDQQSSIAFDFNFLMVSNKLARYQYPVYHSSCKKSTAGKKKENIEEFRRKPRTSDKKSPSRLAMVLQYSNPTPFQKIS